jgi:DNA polymerase-4
VIAWHERKSISTERTFERDTIDVVKLRACSPPWPRASPSKLRKGAKLTSCVAVKIRYADMNTHLKQQRIGYTACDHIILPWSTSSSARSTIAASASA